MTRRHCPTCYRRIDRLHELLDGCPGIPASPPSRQRVRDRRGYVPPSRAGRMSRDEWRENIRVSPEDKLAKQRERQRRYRERKASA